MREKLDKLTKNVIFTPIATVSVALLSWFFCAQGGLWTMFPFVWLIFFFILGLEAHGLFYVCAFSLPSTNKHRPTIYLIFQVYWFLQVPFAGFNGISPIESVLVTQVLLILISIFFFVVLRMIKFFK